MQRNATLFVLIFAVFAIAAAKPVSASWDPEGLPISTALNDQTDSQVISDGVLGAIIAWMDYRSGVV